VIEDGASGDSGSRGEFVDTESWATLFGDELTCGIENCRAMARLQRGAQIRCLDDGHEMTLSAWMHLVQRVHRILRIRSSYAEVMTDLDGAVVLVMGGSGGLGSRIGAQLQQAGCTIVNAERATGDDLRDLGMPSRLLADIVARHGRLDGVVVAAGVVAFGQADALTDATLDELFQVNALGPMRLIRAAVPVLQASSAAGAGNRKPFIVTLSGVVAESPTAGLAAYSASKSALAAFTAAAGRELRRAGIRLLDARPGHTETELSRHPIAGEAFAMGAGLDPDAVAARIVRALVDDERDLPSSAFTA
jgi:NAD(P)-dependent dehydrogenase (short-subunit alcohol dehydrogenase family)